MAKAWRFSVTSLANLALLQQPNGSKYDVVWRWRSIASHRRKIPWSLICGILLFVLGLISLFTGHVASDLEWWYSQRLVKNHLYDKLVLSLLTILKYWYIYIFFL